MRDFADIKITFNFKFIVRSILLMGLLSTGTVHAKGPSFDCAKATTRIEKALCDYPDLGALDTELAQTYKQKHSTGSPVEAKAIKKEQRAWVKERNRKCGKLSRIDEEDRFLGKKGITDCLRGMYKDRISNISEKETKYGDWSVFSAPGKLLVRAAAGGKKHLVFMDKTISSVAMAGATTENNTRSSLLRVSGDYLTYYTETYDRHGAYENYTYDVKVFSMREAKQVTLPDLFEEKVLFQALKQQCDQFICDKSAGSLSTFFQTTKILCQQNKKYSVSKDILSGFYIDDEENGNSKVTLVYQDLCAGNKKGFKSKNITILVK
ncbi:MAG: lysozyme inhibitor LprI family protein [Gammaproteobacteria bacterium]|nr:lysozyme inhibitor LprI family protein [Gammaproteobacteria bacterium]MDH5660080.1 lysozyme inhibitor LprI family protein [Gammaproteobacteria bacterium]